MLRIPDKIQNFRVYTEGEVLLGVAGEIALPELSGMTEAVSGASVLGEYNTAAVGHFSDMEIEIPFINYCKGMFDLADFSSDKNLTLRGAMQERNTATGALEPVGLRISVRGNVTGYTMGTLKAATGAKPTVKLSLTYYLIVYDGEEMFELDKVNGIYKVNGKDVLSKYTALC